jgi:hypothetical protein
MSKPTNFAQIGQQVSQGKIIDSQNLVRSKSNMPQNGISHN